MESTDGYLSRNLVENEKQYKTGNHNSIPYAEISNNIDDDQLKDFYKDVMLNIWKFKIPQIVISIHGTNKPLELDKILDKKLDKIFKQNLTDIMKQATMWIITSGNNNDVNELVCEAVYENRLDKCINKSNLLGIFNGDLKPRGGLEDNREFELDINKIYSGYLLYKSENNSNHYQENVRSKFEKFFKKARIHIVNIFFNGNIEIFNPVFSSLNYSIPVIIIKENSEIAKEICKLIEMNENENETNINSNNDRMQLILSEINDNFKKKIVLWDIETNSVKLNNLILDAFISDYQTIESSGVTLYRGSRCQAIVVNHSTSQEDIYDEWEPFELACIFNEKYLTETSFLENANFEKLTDDKKISILNIILKNDKARVLRMLIKTGISIDNYVDETFFKELYQDSINGKLGCMELLQKNIPKSKEITFRKKSKPKSAEMEMNYSNNSENQIPRLILRESNGKINNKRRIEIEKIFIWALLSGCTSVAFVLWQFGHEFIGAALNGAIILKKMERYYKAKCLNDLSKKYSCESKRYKDLANRIISEAYEKSPVRAIALITRPLVRWGNKSCIEIAVAGRLKEFCNNSACKHYTHHAWYNKSLLKNAAKNGDEIESLTEKMNRLFGAPIVKYALYWISYLIFIILFIGLNLINLKPISEVKSKAELAPEFIILLYIFGLLVEEIKQVIHQDGTTICSKLNRYIGFWNVFDVLIIILFFVSMICRFSIQDDNFVIIRCFYAVTLSLFILRSFQIFFILPNMGPKVIMIKKMLIDVLFFFGLFIIFILAYGTLCQSITNPNRNLDIILIKDILFYPYFQVYGELEMDKFEIPSICNGTNCRVKWSTVMIGFGIYLLLTHILLINLLIAMFGHTFNKVQAKVENHFSFNNIELLKEFHQRSFCPPPFNLLEYFVIKIYKVCQNNIGSGTYNVLLNLDLNTVLQEKIEPIFDKNLQEFEEKCLESLSLECPDEKCDCLLDNSNCNAI